MSVGTLVGSGRVDPYVLDVASMHASALAFLNEYDVSTFHWRLRRSASRPHVYAVPTTPAGDDDKTR